MPLKSGKMTKPEKAFSAHYASTGNATYSAAAAGYSSPQPRSSELLQRPAVQEEIRRQQVARLFQEALPAAVQCLVSIMTDAKAPAGARVQASKVVLDRTLGDKEEGQRKEPHEMSADEIAKAIDELERVAASRAKSIDSAQEVRNDANIFE